MTHAAAASPRTAAVAITLGAVVASRRYSTVLYCFSPNPRGYPRQVASRRYYTLHYIASYRYYALLLLVLLYVWLRLPLWLG